MYLESPCLQASVQGVLFARIDTLIKRFSHTLSHVPIPHVPPHQLTGIGTLVSTTFSNNYRNIIIASLLFSLPDEIMIEPYLSSSSLDPYV